MTVPERQLKPAAGDDTDDKARCEECHKELLGHSLSPPDELTEPNLAGATTLPGEKSNTEEPSGNLAGIGVIS